MHIETYYDGVELHRGDKIIYGRFLEQHLVISTCQVQGGVAEDLDYVLNHQSCEPCNHLRDMNYRDARAYHRSICEPHGLPSERCAAMGTAANMNHAAFVSKKYADLEVIAVVTGGVETNAGRAGDPAALIETPEGFQSLEKIVKIPGPGTINVMLFISQSLSRAALTRSIMLVTEAKAAALQELNVNSRYSDGLATGTGTDQIIISAPKREGYQLSWVGKHNKLGELIGRSVKQAVKESLSKQGELTAQGQCSVKIHLERFGATRAVMIQEACLHLDETRARLFRDNFVGVLRDPITVAAAAAIAHLRDKFSWGVLPTSCWPEIMSSAAACMACSVSGRYEQMDTYRQKLERATGKQQNSDFIKLCCRALALGFNDKWPDAQQVKDAATQLKEAGMP